MISFEKDHVRFNYRVAGVAVRDRRVLLHRTEEEDFWSLPGGRCEMGEPSREALRREMREELAVDVEVERLLWVVENFFSYNGQECHEVGFYYLMAFPDDSPLHAMGEAFLGDELGTKLIFRWHDLATINDLPIYPSFLRDGLAAIPATLEHVVHVDGA
jgi:ADP-ribose pyrophosphatase YjhB (NUDIX family)